MSGNNGLSYCVQFSSYFWPLPLVPFEWKLSMKGELLRAPRVEQRLLSLELGLRAARGRWGLGRLSALLRGDVCVAQVKHSLTSRLIFVYDMCVR